MNPLVLTSIANADPNANPVTINDLIAVLNPLLTSVIQGSYVPYVIGSITPSVDDQDKAWVQLDSGGRPLAIKTFYNGNWRRVYNGMLGEVRGYTGDPSVDFDTTGLGLVGQTYDGWALMNGQNGTTDFSDKFLIGGHMNNAAGHVGYNSGWQTFANGIADLQSGGTASITSDATNTYQPVIPDIKVDKYSATGNTNDPTGILYGPNSVQHLELFPGLPGLATPNPIPILNPFIALGWITFVGYA